MEKKVAKYVIKEYGVMESHRTRFETEYVPATKYTVQFEVDYEQLVELNNEKGDVLLTSPYKFVNKLYLIFKEDKINEVYEIKRIEKYKIKYPEGVNPSEVYWDTGEVPFEKEKFKEKIVKYFKNKLINYLYVNNYCIDVLKTQNLPVEEEELEEFIINFYEMQGYTLLNKCDIEEAKKFTNVKIVDGFGFVEEGVVDEVYKKIDEERRRKFVEKEAKEFIEKAEEFLKYGLYQFQRKNHIRDKIEKPDFYFLDDLINLDDKLVEEVKILKEKIDNLEVVDLWSLIGFIVVEKNKKFWKVKVPDDLKGRFIGKGGENVKSLAKKYSIKIKVV